MNRQETQLIIKLITNSYPPNLTNDITSQMVDTWFQMLKDLDYQKVQIAVVSLVATGKYPPSIAEIRGSVTASQTRVTPDQAWGKIMRAVAQYGWSQPNEAQASLGTDIWALVDRFGWTHYCELDMSNESTHYAQFRDAYNMEQKRQRNLEQIPSAVLEKLKLIGG